MLHLNAAFVKSTGNPNLSMGVLFTAAENKEALKEQSNNEFAYLTSSFNHFFLETHNESS